MASSRRWRRGGGPGLGRNGWKARAETRAWRAWISSGARRLAGPSTSTCRSKSRAPRRLLAARRRRTAWDSSGHRICACAASRSSRPARRHLLDDRRRHRPGDARATPVAEPLPLNRGAGVGPARDNGFPASSSRDLLAAARGASPPRPPDRWAPVRPVRSRICGAPRSNGGPWLDLDARTRSSCASWGRRAAWSTVRDELDGAQEAARTAKTRSSVTGAMPGQPRRDAADLLKRGAGSS